jgi:hypothetical protein
MHVLGIVPWIFPRTPQFYIPNFPSYFFVQHYSEADLIMQRAPLDVLYV